jgi:hypothetical protein
MYGPSIPDTAADILHLRTCAHALLTDMCTTQVLTSTTAHSASGTSRLLTPVLLALRPLDDALQRELIISALSTHPALQLPYVRGCSILGSPPGVSMRYLASSDFLCRLLVLPLGPSHDPACLLSSDGSGSPMADSLADLVSPKSASGAILSTGMQHASAMVRLSAIRVVVCILSRLGKAVQWAAEQRAPAGVAEEARRMVRARLPDFQVLIAARHAAVARLSNGSDAPSPDKTTARLLLPRILQAMALYLARFPESLAESRVDLARFVAEKGTLSDPAVLSQTLSVLRAAPPMSGNWFAAPKEGSTTPCNSSNNNSKSGDKTKDSDTACEARTHLGCILALYVDDNPPLPAPLRKKLAALARKVLTESGLVGERDGEGVAWLRALRNRQRAACLECLSLEASKAVHKLSMEASALQGRAGGVPHAGVSPLLLCALRRVRADDVDSEWDAYVSEVAAELFHSISPVQALALETRECLRGRIASVSRYFKRMAEGIAAAHPDGLVADEQAKKGSSKHDIKSIANKSNGDAQDEAVAQDSGSEELAAEFARLVDIGSGTEDDRKNLAGMMWSNLERSLFDHEKVSLFLSFCAMVFLICGI